MDKDITEMEPNDFGALRTEAPKLKLVCFNGKEAARVEEDARRLGYHTEVLPSSSGANRNNQEERLNCWKNALRP